MGRGRRSIGCLALTAVVALLLSGCATLDAIGADAPRDAEGRPIAPQPAPPSTCVTPPGSADASCLPVHNPPSRLYVEQAIPRLLPTRGYGSIEHVRCTTRMPDPPSSSDPTGIYRTSHWTCVGREPEGDYLHQDVIWNPYGGLLVLAAVSRDRSSALTVPDPDDPGLPNPHASETATPSAG